jgi:hypothetical protein
VAVNDLVCKCTHILTSVSKLFTIYKLVKVKQPKSIGNSTLSSIESTSEGTLSYFLWSDKTSHGFAKEEGGSCVKGQTKEQRLKVDRVISLTNMLDKIVYSCSKNL